MRTPAGRALDIIHYRRDRQWVNMTDMPDSDTEKSHAPPPQLFVVRLWWEADDEGIAGEWRGWVEHTSTHERRYFREVENVAAFIKSRLPKKKDG